MHRALVLTTAYPWRPWISSICYSSVPQNLSEGLYSVLLWIIIANIFYVLTVSGIYHSSVPQNLSEGLYSVLLWIILSNIFTYTLFNGLAIVYSRYTIKDTYSARVLLPMDMVLLGKWYSIRVCLFPR